MSQRRLFGVLGAVACVGLAVACSASTSSSSAGNAGGNGGNQGGAGGAQGGSAGSGNTGNTGIGGVNFGGSGGGTGASGTNCNTGPDEDGDGDGFSKNQGDCNDCDPNVSPNGLEVINSDPNAEPADEDCDGVVDNPPPDTCDAGLAIDDADPFDGAKAIDICKIANGAGDWGVVDAEYTRADGPGSFGAPPGALQYGLLDDFGPNVAVQKGARMLGLSAGYARAQFDPNPCGNCYCSSNFGGVPPPGFPQDVNGCNPSPAINDDVALNLTLRAPSNATGYKFLFKFYSFEFPEYVCSSFNDQFIALVNPPPMGSVNGNISFDSAMNPVSVNVGFFDVCDPALLVYYSQYGNGALPPPGTCSSGTAELIGTGFNKGEFGAGCSGDGGGADAGGTGWLQTSAPIGGGETFELRFAIWDAGDSAYDSTVIIDGFEWIANGGTVNVGTDPLRDPK